ncbi:MAG: FAD-dependent monooxygenase [Chthoniobacterales bacterium]|nr:FAD-dependent monooxygenase [Chthoniobacterales bacterium]
MKKPDILIVGAGPTGLTLAIECCRHGVTPRIIDHTASRSPYSKALVLWSATLECFSAMGVVEEFLQSGHPMRRLIFADHGKILNEIPSSNGVDSAYPLPILLPQNKTEEILERRLAALGVEVERDVTLTHCTQNDNSVIATITKKEGTSENHSFSFLAACDGARSTVRHQLELPFEGETEPLAFVLADAKIEGDLPDDGMFLNWGREKNATIFFPLGKGLFRVVAQRKDLTNKNVPTLEEMQGYLNQSGLGHWRIHEPEWLSYFSVNERIVSCNRIGRIFLLGDAAHIHSPAGGQGMNTGIQDACNLGWKLALLTKKVSNAELIAESYVQERYPVAKNLIKETSQLLHAGVNQTLLTRIMKDIVVAFLLHIPALQQLLAAKFSEMNIHYPSSSLILHDALSVDKRPYQAGWRIYEVSLVEATTQKTISLWKQLLHPKHTLLLFSGTYLSEEMRLLLQRLASDEMIATIEAKPLMIWHGEVLFNKMNYEEKASHFLDPQGLAHNRFGITSPSWILVRPDFYVAARGVIEEQDRLERYCSRLA